MTMQRAMMPAMSMSGSYPASAQVRHQRVNEYCRAHDDAGVGRADGIDVTHLEARALADEPAGGEVPGVQAVLVVDVQPAAGRPREVDRGRPEAAHVAAVRKQAGDDRGLRAAHL